MDLANALETAGKLRAALAAEVERAREEREVLSALDANALLACAAERGAFVSTAARLERELSAELAAAAAPLGTDRPSLDELRARAPVEGEALAGTMAEVRALAAALREADQVNRELAERALVCVRGWVELISPSPKAYDRRGLRARVFSGAATIHTQG